MNEFPVTPKLPEHYQAETIHGMMPDQIIFPLSSVYKADEATREIYVELQQRVHTFETHPTYFGDGRTALMKVLLICDAGEVEGYIADLRHVTPGTIYERALSKTDDMSYRDVQELEETNNNFAPLLGAVLIDFDGNEYYSGDERLVDHAAHLAVALDELQEEHDSALKRSIEERIEATKLPNAVATEAVAANE